jgi:hypothetical protein
MPRDRNSDMRQLRHLVGKYYPHLLAQLEPPKGSQKADPLPGLELFVRIARRERRMSRTAALRWLANAVMQARIANSADALVARWRRKLHGGGFTTRSDKRLVQDMGLPPEIDPSKFTLRTTRE